MIDIP